MDIINLDNAASTPVLPEVWEAMRPYMLTEAGNPASSHTLGRRARRALEDAREQIAQLLDAHPDEVLFTSGATEANNLAIFGLAGAPPGVLVSSAIEHPCVVEPIRRLKERGFRVIEFPVNREGIVQPLPEGWPEQTRLVTVMLGNHETGAIQPVAELARSLPSGVALHCDAAAVAGKIAISFRELGGASLTISAHKFHGPKGIGALLLRRDVPFQPQLFGGHQQQARRPGTEPVALAVGMAVALAIATRRQEDHRRHVEALRRHFLERLRAHASPVVLNGPEAGGLPHTLNVSFPGCAADALLMKLDLAGVACSTGSACSSGSLLPSPVLIAMEISPENLASALRFSLSALTKFSEMEEALTRIINSVNSLRTKTSRLPALMK